MSLSFLAYLNFSARRKLKQLRFISLRLGAYVLIGIIALVMLGLSYDPIAEKLGIETRTVIAKDLSKEQGKTETLKTANVELEKTVKDSNESNKLAIDTVNSKTEDQLVTNESLSNIDDEADKKVMDLVTSDKKPKPTKLKKQIKEKVDSAEPKSKDKKVQPEEDSETEKYTEAQKTQIAQYNMEAINKAYQEIMEI